jgi:hypothetical protein
MPLRCRGGRRSRTLSFSEEWSRSFRITVGQNSIIRARQAGTYRRGTRNEKIGLLLSLLLSPSSEERGLGIRRRMRHAFGGECPRSLLVRYFHVGTMCRTGSIRDVLRSSNEVAWQGRWRIDFPVKRKILVMRHVEAAHVWGTRTMRRWHGGLTKHPCPRDTKHRQLELRSCFVGSATSRLADRNVGGHGHGVGYSG